MAKIWNQSLLLTILLCLIDDLVLHHAGTMAKEEGVCGRVDIHSSTSKESCDPCDLGKWFSLILNQRAETIEESSCFNNFPLGQHSPFLCPHDLTKGHIYPKLDLTKTPRGFIMSDVPFFRYNTKLKSADNVCNSKKFKDDCPEECNVISTDSSAAADNLDIGHVKRYYYQTVKPALSNTNTTEEVGSKNNTDTTDENANNNNTTEVYPKEEEATEGVFYFKKRQADVIDNTGEESSNSTEADGSLLLHDVDFQVLEWPGRTTKDQNIYLQSKVAEECAADYKSHKPSLCTIYKNEKRNFQILKFHKDSSKFLHYPCNAEEGTTIVALGLVAVYEETETEEDPHSKLFLSYSNTSIYNAPAHPLSVAEIILNEMAKRKDAFPRAICRIASEEPKNCDFTKSIPDQLPPTAGDCDWRQKYFQDRGNIIMDKEKCQSTASETDSCSKCRKPARALTGDLRTVLDFTFIQRRLLLGMRCGILVVDGFLNKGLDIKAATLLSSEGRHKNTFSPVNIISSSFCCKLSGCKRTIVAAYSSYEGRAVDSPKEIYVSFDLGDTFQVKLLTEHVSALNLMWGMYKVYSDWVLYYQMLETPDPEDLKDERGEELHPGYVELRASSDWDSLTATMKEIRFLYGQSASEPHMKDLEVRKRAFRRYHRLRTAGALGRFVRHRKQNKFFKLDLSPEWLKNEIGENRQQSKTPWQDRWTDENCDSIPQCRNNFVNDVAVSYLLNQSNVIVKTPKKAIEEPFCDQIMSMLVLDEEDSLYVLCRIGFGDFSKPFGSDNSSFTSCNSRSIKGEHEAHPDCRYPINPSKNQESKDYAYNECVNPIKYYAIFTLSVKEKLPLVLIEERRSERLFTCKPIMAQLDWDGCKNKLVLPELIRVHSSVQLLVKNCEDVLYYSPNGGRTMYNTQFYAHHSEFVGTDSAADNCVQTSHCQAYGNDTEKRILTYRLRSLDIPPLISISRYTTAVLMTMKNVYAYGIMGINKEFRMVVGEIFPDTSENIISLIRSNEFIFPDFAPSGVPFFGVALKLIYGHNRIISCELYQNRHGMRLVPMEFFFYKDLSYYYHENLDLDAEVRFGNLASGACHTYSFSVNPNYLSLDVDEGGIVEVTSYDLQTNIHLGLVSSEEKSIIVDVSIVDRGRLDDEHLAHDWDIHVKAIRNYKPRETVLVESFFGVENNNMFGFYTHVGLANDVEFRCHVQPSDTVSVRIECRDKMLVVHEDEHRPQCIRGTFSKSAFEYRLKKGDFEPYLAGYWMGLNEIDGKELIKLDRETGDLIITYDYLRFGCPLEPYKDDVFIPDLRIATADTKYNSSLGKLYNGSFLLIELFGSEGFFFSKTFNDYECTYLPMNLTELTLDWIHRQRMFRTVYGRQKSITDIKTILNAKTSEELDHVEYGNSLFIPDAVDHPINIVNRATYRDCKKWRSFFLETENQSFSKLEDVSEETQKLYLDQKLPILRRGESNVVTWSKRSQEVYIFIAIALDPSESLCEYFNIFGVHLPKQADIEVLITFLVFICLVFMWIMMFICGYMFRKSRIRSLCIQIERKRRLEEAAWKVVYQYEKLLQENENKRFEEEFSEHSNKVQQMDNEKMEKQTGNVPIHQEPKIPAKGNAKRRK